ncbi:MAG: flagellar biosynthesis protein FlhA [Pseudomonadota bacterium]
MTDTSVADTGAKTSSGFSLGALAAFLRQGDIALAMGVIIILVMLIMPMPPFMLDVFLAISIIFSVLVLMTALFIHAPLEFSSFPTVLLIATMLRLALNLASTRLILANGHEGPHAAGNVIEAFGEFVSRGNFVIGLIVFAILVIVNFIVITKGSGRIAEVSARFTLDAMPGKQMAIDADLSAGIISEDEARARRKQLEDESSFFGAMDGASKFVRGDAIAGLMITFINIVGGIVIGIMQQDLSFADAGRTYTLLTIGDGLVSQIPALIVSTAAGLLVSKAGVRGAADEALVQQLTRYPKAFGMSAFVMTFMSVLPGMPTMIFLVLAGGAGYLAYYGHRLKKDEKAKEGMKTTADGTPMSEEEAPKEPDIRESLKMDDLRIEVGYGLLSLINESEGSERLTEQIKALRRQLANDLGFVMPSVRLLDNLQSQPNEYAIKVKEVSAGGGEVFPDKLMVMDPTGAKVTLQGINTIEPTFGLPATWIDQAKRVEADNMGYTVVDPSTVISTHMSEVMKANVAELLSYSVVQDLLAELTPQQSKLVDDMVPNQITVSGIQRVLQGLLAERVSIRDLPTILEAIAEAAGAINTTSGLVEHVRSRLARQITAQHTAPQGYLPMVTLSPQWETAFAEALVGDGEEKQLAIAPSKIQEFVTVVRDAFEDAARMGEVPVLLASPGIRGHVRSIVERFRPQTAIMSQAEVHPRAKLKTVGTV